MLLDTIRSAADEDGFVLCGVAPAIESAGQSDLIRWIEAGYAGQMQYLADRIDAYQHPAGVLDGAKSIVALAFPYASRNPSTPEFNDAPIGHGKVARYAWSGIDYHDVIHPKLKRICRIINEAVPGAAARGVVDTAPISEREIAQLAGLGWRGKNTLLIHPGLGSYFFLACVLTDVELPHSEPFSAMHCGTCTACLDACPTDAFVDAGVMNASRCISYLTIEHRGPIDPSLRAGIGDWAFGCDVCQEVCPWNRKPSRRDERPIQPIESLDLAELFTISDEDFRTRFRKSPMWRTRRRGMLRNAAIVLGNQADPSAIEPLLIGLADQDPIIRGASVWALGRIGTAAAMSPLRDLLKTETDSDVIEELAGAFA
ncbi:MAG: tRNA epoxyqueuosine(34) reductase QueG [Rubripirellula sp.]